MKYIRQRHANGCGVASLAMATGISYDRAMKLIAPNRKKGTVFEGILLEQTLKALNDMGATYRVRFDRKLRQIKNDALISISLPCGCRHAVAWDAKTKQILDPDPVESGHDGVLLHITAGYVQENLNYIIEVIPS